MKYLLYVNYNVGIGFVIIYILMIGYLIFNKVFNKNNYIYSELNNEIDKINELEDTLAKIQSQIEKGDFEEIFTEIEVENIKKNAKDLKKHIKSKRKVILEEYSKAESILDTINEDNTFK